MGCAVVWDGGIFLLGAIDCIPISAARAAVFAARGDLLSLTSACIVLFGWGRYLARLVLGPPPTGIVFVATPLRAPPREAALAERIRRSL